MVPLSCAVATSAFAASYLFTELGSQVVDFFISVGLPFLSVIVLMKILSGQGV